MIIKIITGVVAVIAVFLGYVALQPSQMNVSRELLVKVSPEIVFPYINNSKKTNDWMPWSESDPEVKMEYSGPEEGLGSKSSWISTGKMGVGEALVVESILNKLVRTKLTYSKPMQMTQMAEVSLTSVNDGTIVRWSVTGESSFIGRMFCVFMDMDKVVGNEFEKGLAKLKMITEQVK